MRYVRPFDLDEDSGWIVSQDEGLGCAIRIATGSRAAAQSAETFDRFAIVLRGEATLATAEGSTVARTDDMIFVPAGAVGSITGGADAAWAYVEAPLPTGEASRLGEKPRVVKIDPARFEGAGFAYQSLIDRDHGAASLRMNVLRVAPGAGSPDWHIHAFAQLYLITEGEMTIDIGKRRTVVGPNTLAIFPAGVVHRNFNASDSVERHFTILVPEPKDGDIFDFAVTIHEEEAQLMAELPR